MSDYHENLINHISDYGYTIGKVTDVYPSGQHNIPIAHGDPSVQLPPLYYKPDVQYYIYRGRRTRYYHIFEVIYKQGTAQTIADILRVFLSDLTIDRLFFIVPTIKKREETDKVRKIIVDQLTRVTGGSLPFDTRVIMIARNKSNDQQFIYDKFDNEVLSLI